MKTKLLPTLFVSLCLLAARGQNTVFTYQGRVMDNGTNFSGTGQFKFALVTSTNVNHQATATANMGGVSPNEFVSSCAINAGGNGYVTAPSVSFSGGGGSGATGQANLTGDAISSITILSPGSGYSNSPTVSIAPPPANIFYTNFWSNDGTSVNGSEPATAVSVAVNNGLFTVALGDTTQPNMTAIAASVFTQPNLQLRIWFNDGLSGSVALDPAQDLTPAPYAAFALTASNLVNNSLNGLTIRPNTNGAPDVIGGAPDNYVPTNVIGATIAGGGATNFAGNASSNSVTANFGTVGGGTRNTAGNYDTVGGGNGNTASGTWSTVGGGNGNTASGNASTIPGGEDDLASGLWSLACGVNAQATNTASFVWSDSTLYRSSADYQFSVHAKGGIRLSGDVQLDNSTYHYLSLDGGNSIGYLYGSYPALGDGVHLGYNYYADATGAGHVINAGGGTSRISPGYGAIDLAVGPAGGPPTNVMMDVSGAGVVIYAPTNTFSDYSLDVKSSAWMENNLYLGTYGSWNGYLQVNGLTTIYNGLNVYGNGGNYVYFGCNLEVNGAAYKPGGGSWSSLSDERLKENIQPLTGALDKLLALHGVTFEFKDPEKIHELSGERMGMIAQQVEKVFPDWVATGKDGYKRLTYRGFEALTVEALRELRAEKDARIAALEKQNTAMENELAAQKKINSQMEAKFDALQKAVARLDEASNRTLADDSN